MSDQLTPNSGSGTQTSGGGPTLPGDELAVWAVLLETREDPDEENVETRPRTWLELVGTMTAKARTQRSTLLEKLLAGQGGVDMEVPQVPLWNGQDGELHLIPQRLLDEGVPVRAVQRLIFEVVAESGETS